MKNPTELSVEQDNDSMVSSNHPFTFSQPAKSTPLREAVQVVIEEYFVRFGATPGNLYELFLEEVEVPLLEIVLHFTRENQSRAAKYLKLSRGNLRTKMKHYGFLNPRRKRKDRNESVNRS